MAKFKYYQNLETGLSDFQSMSLKVKDKGSTAVWTDAETGARVVMEGKNFEISSEDETQLSAGKINSVTLTDGDKKLVVEVSDLNLRADKLMAAYNDGGVDNAAFYATKGDDSVIGSGKQDYLVSGAGDDVLTGKGGSDYFVFQMRSEIWTGRQVAAEYDIITDFDWKGDDADRLEITQDFDVRSAHQGDDTLLRFEDGSSLLLEGVKKAQFENYWETQTML